MVEIRTVSKLTSGQISESIQDFGLLQAIELATKQLLSDQVDDIDVSREAIRRTRSESSDSKQQEPRRV